MNRTCKCVFCNKPKWLTTEDYIIETAKFLGYPKCCTKEFLQDVLKNKPHGPKLRYDANCKLRKDYSYDTGFVPCLDHAHKIVNEGKNIKRIFRKRICSTAFPYAGADEFKKYLKKVKKQYEDN